MTRAAIIVGAGIGGLTAAIALRRIGWTVTVLERALRFDAVGAGLSLAPNAMRGLDAIGVGPRVRTVGVPTAAASAIRRPDGRFFIRTHQAPETLPLLAYQRAALHRDLLGALPPECVRLDAEVLGVDPAPPSPSVQLSDGNLKADLVVAADGIHSRIRRQHWPDATEEFLNYAAWVGLADLDEPVGPGTESGLAGSMTLSRGRYFLIHPVGPQRVYWALGERADDAGVRSEDELAQVRSRVGGWHDPIPRLLDATLPDRVKRLDIQAVPELPTYVRGSLVLLGDAAHAMSPDRGQGAGQSIEDAVVLASLLSESTTIEQALQAYDSIRRPRAQMVARDAQRVGQSIINAGPLSYRLMAAMLGLMPAGLWKWFTGPDGNAIWGWRPPIVPDRQG